MTLTKQQTLSLGKFISEPNQVIISAYMPDPITEHMHVIRLIGGAQVQASSGLKVLVLGFDAQGNQASGRVVTSGRQMPVKSGQVIITYSNGISGFI